MNPRRGENPPFRSNSRSQTCRGVRSQEAHSREFLCSSAARSREAIKLTSSPPCGRGKLSGVRLEPCSSVVVISSSYTCVLFKVCSCQERFARRHDFSGSRELQRCHSLASVACRGCLPATTIWVN